MTHPTSPLTNRNADVLAPYDAGLSGAHTKKDGNSAFVGYFGAAHAGKMVASSLGNAETGIAGPNSALDSLGQIRKFGRVGHETVLQVRWLHGEQTVWWLRRRGGANSALGQIRKFGWVRHT